MKGLPALSLSNGADCLPVFVEFHDRVRVVARHQNAAAPMVDESRSAAMRAAPQTASRASRPKSDSGSAYSHIPDCRCATAALRDRRLPDRSARIRAGRARQRRGRQRPRTMPARYRSFYENSPPSGQHRIARRIERCLYAPLLQDLRDPGAGMVRDVRRRRFDRRGAVTKRLQIAALRVGRIFESGAPRNPPRRQAAPARKRCGRRNASACSKNSRMVFGRNSKARWDDAVIARPR